MSLAFGIIQYPGSNYPPKLGEAGKFEPTLGVGVPGGDSDGGGIG